MSVRSVSIAAGNAAAIADLMRSWRSYHCSGSLGQFMSPAPQQNRVTLTIGGQARRFRPSDFSIDGVMLLFSEGGSFDVVFYDWSLNEGQGGFLPAIVTLSVADRTKLGSRRRTREQFLRELILPARQLQQQLDAANERRRAKAGQRA